MKTVDEYASSSTSESNATANEAAAAKEAARQAAASAKQLAGSAAEKIMRLEPMQLAVAGLLSLVLATTFLFDMASFSVFSDGAVTETQAAAERSLEARMNSWSYTALASSLTGKLMWLSALLGVGFILYPAFANRHSAWVPLAQVASYGRLCLLDAPVAVRGLPQTCKESSPRSFRTCGRRRQ